MAENSDLVPWSQCAFEEIQKTITDKKFSMNVCFLTFTVLELLMGFVDDIISFDELLENDLSMTTISEEYLGRKMGEKSNPTSISNDIVYSSRTRRRIFLASVCMERTSPMFLCCRKYKLNYERCGFCYLLTTSNYVLTF